MFQEIFKLNFPSKESPKQFWTKNKSLVEMVGADMVPPEMFAWLHLINQTTVDCILKIVNLGKTSIFGGHAVFQNPQTWWKLCIMYLLHVLNWLQQHMFLVLTYYTRFLRFKKLLSVKCYCPQFKIQTKWSYYSTTKKKNKNEYIGHVGKLLPACVGQTTAE